MIPETDRVLAYFLIMGYFFDAYNPVIYILYNIIDDVIQQYVKDRFHYRI